MRIDSLSYYLNSLGLPIRIILCLLCCQEKETYKYYLFPLLIKFSYYGSSNGCGCVAGIEVRANEVGFHDER